MALYDRLHARLAAYTFWSLLLLLLMLLLGAVALAVAVAFAFAVAAAVIRPYPLFPLLKSDKHVICCHRASEVGLPNLG